MNCFLEHDRWRGKQRTMTLAAKPIMQNASKLEGMHYIFRHFRNTRRRTYHKKVKGSRIFRLFSKLQFFFSVAKKVYDTRSVDQVQRNQYDTAVAFIKKQNLIPSLDQYKTVLAITTGALCRVYQNRGCAQSFSSGLQILFLVLQHLGYLISRICTLDW